MDDGLEQNPAYSPLDYRTHLCYTRSTAARLPLTTIIDPMGDSVVPCKRCSKASGVRAGWVQVGDRIVWYAACRVCYDTFEKAEKMAGAMYRKGASDDSH